MGNAPPQRAVKGSSYGALAAVKPGLQPIAWHDLGGWDACLDSEVTGEFRMCLHSNPAQLGFEIDVSDGVSLVIADVRLAGMLSTGALTGFPRSTASGGQPTSS
mmetsp:Transcript_100807/g.289723  ORF Transcript_100807/g.289723 Transcript_100807/m.289723 type:complete len:104 (+) Transcript_100807:86-397(+)